MLQRSVGIIDIFLVGGLGASSIAAVGIAQIMVFVVMSVSRGINVGVTIQVAQLWGADRKADAAKAAYRAMLLMSGAYGPGTFFSGSVAAVLGAQAEVRGLLRMSLLLWRYRKESWNRLEL